MMRFALVMVLIIGLCMFGCVGDSKSEAAAQQKIQEASNYMNLAKQKLNEGTVAYEAGRYSDARSSYSEAKTYAVKARNKVEEVCNMPEYSGDESCDTIEIIDDCLNPPIDLLTSLSYLIEDIEDNCGLFGCPSSIKTRCTNIAMQASAIDAKCDTDMSSDVSDMCAQIN